MLTTAARGGSVPVLFMSFDNDNIAGLQDQLITRPVHDDASTAQAE
jgi:hypothetical protein